MTNRYPTSAEFPDDIRPELKKKCDSINASLRIELTDHLRFRYEMGKTIQEILSDRDTYGDRPLHHLERELKIPQSRLCDHVRVVEAFTQEQLDELAKRSVETGVPLSFSHLVELTHIAAESKRKKFIERIFDKGLSANQLHDEVFALIGPRRKSGAGRKPKRATSPMAGYTDLIKTTTKYCKKVTEVWVPVFTEVNEVSPDKLDKQFLGQMEQAFDEVCGMLSTLEQVRDAIQLNRQRTTDVLALREGQQSKTPVDAEPLKEDEAASLSTEPNELDDEDPFGEEPEGFDSDGDAEIEQDHADDDPFGFHDDDEFETEAA